MVRGCQGFEGLGFQRVSELCVRVFFFFFGGGGVGIAKGFDQNCAALRVRILVARAAV